MLTILGSVIFIWQINYSIFCKMKSVMEGFFISEINRSIQVAMSVGKVIWRPDERSALASDSGKLAFHLGTKG